MEFNKRCYRQKGESVWGEIVCNENYASLGLRKKLFEVYRESLFDTQDDRLWVECKLSHVFLLTAKAAESFY